MRRNERMSAMMKILTASPNKIFTLSYFCDLFGAAKSTMSEDIDILRDVVSRFGLGELETVTGAAGGVRYRTKVRRPAARQFISGLCQQLSGSQRVLPGGFLYTSDVLADPEIVDRMGEIIATEYFATQPDFVLTMETKGIPVAFSTAQALGVPLVIARRKSKAYEGSEININYVSGSGTIGTMSLSRRAVKEGSRCLIVDDFLKGGGTAKGMVDLMREFGAEVVGMAFVMSTAKPLKKRISGEKSLMVLELDADAETAVVKPAFWLNGDT
ncbi:MAG: pur operon repressor [Clostridia bacterium]|nr:pur operon repressor [Clostridia bacterium]